MFRTLTLLLGNYLCKQLVIFFVARPVRNLAVLAAVVPAKSDSNDGVSCRATFTFPISNGLMNDRSIITLK
jgi:hypothetical protein